MMRWWTLLVLLVAGAVFTWPCGPFFAELEYAPFHGPVKSGPATERFDRGELGVVRPEFYRRNLVVAYRYLAGVPLSESEIKAIQPQEPAQDSRPSDEWTAASRWLKARKTVPGAPDVQNIDADKQIPGSQFEMFANCLDAAFDTAAATLRDRQAKWGASNEKVTEWLKGQDQVFENCSGGPRIPAAVSGGDPLLTADRQYQIAAAAFYAAKYDDAQRDFEAVATNASSPWRDGGHYLAARALIREGTIHSKPESLKAAEAKLRAVIGDPAQQRWHDSARGLIEYIHATLEPKQTLDALGRQMMRPGGDLQKALTDYTQLYDRMEEKKDETAAGSELTDWIDTFQNRKTGHALERWRTGKSMPWLVASLTAVEASDAAVPELIAAARKVAPEVPAYASATIYGIRLERQRGQVDAAREWADRALAAAQPDPTANLLRAERLAMARDWSEFLKFGPRKPIAMAFEEVGSDEPLDQDPDLQKRSVAFDDDFTGPMNVSVPLDLWDAAARDNALPPVFQAEIAQAGWVRAVLLEDGPAARKLASRVGELNPPLVQAMRDYAAQADPAAARFTAVFWMLRTPGLGPELRSGVGRTTKVGEIDSFRDNWWNNVEAKANPGGADFLPKEQRAAGEAQSAQLRSVGTGVNYLCAAAIAWAKAHPQDPRVPEALHLAVRATRYGVTDQESSRYSKEAFDILHRKYPNSPWTKQTKYWF
jgi:tetratricopeptide (TPR) repeat protein